MRQLAGPYWQLQLPGLQQPEASNCACRNGFFCHILHAVVMTPNFPLSLPVAVMCFQQDSPVGLIGPVLRAATIRFRKRRLVYICRPASPAHAHKCWDWSLYAVLTQCSVLVWCHGLVLACGVLMLGCCVLSFADSCTRTECWLKRSGVLNCYYWTELLNQHR